VLSARHWTFSNNGSYALTSNEGTAVLTNTIVATHSSGGFSGAGITADTTLFHQSDIPCTNGAVCNNNLNGDPGFVGATSGDYHLTAGSAAIDVGIDTGLRQDLDGHHRPYGFGPDLGADELIAATVSPGSETRLVYTDTLGSPTTLAFPGSAVTESVTIVYTPADTADAAPGQIFAGHAFEMDAFQGGALLPSFTFSSPVTISIHYTDLEIAGLAENTLTLMFWNGSEWQDASCGLYDRRPNEDWLALPVCHLSQFALFGEYQLYLPFISRMSP
jgi:hypothetical protein